MNITPHAANLPLATVVNQPTESLRRDNHQQEVIKQVTAANPSAAEKGVASDKERARTPAQTNEQVDFANLRKQAENAASVISDQENPQGDQQGEQQNAENHQEDQTAHADGSQTEHSSHDGEHSDEEIAQAKADERVISELQNRDQEVRTHELAHASVGGSTTGSPSYTFEVGPDGKKYAVGGEVSVDLSAVAGDPQATITKMQKVHAAALAPANPSSQDIKVAGTAARKILAAQTELATQKSDKAEESTSVNKTRDYNANSSFHVSNEANESSSEEFDTFINQTLSAQDAVTAKANTAAVSSNNLQSDEVRQRAHRVESFYYTVSQGYERPDNFQFELTA